MTPVYYRSAEMRDIPDLITIENTCFHSDIISKRQMKYMIKKAKCIFLVACDEKKHTVLGYGLCLTPSARKTARLYSLAVLPLYRGLSIGHVLSKTILQQLTAHGYLFCTLDVRISDTKAQKLYHKLGFMRYKSTPHYYDDGESALHMRRTL